MAKWGTKEGTIHLSPEQIADAMFDQWCRNNVHALLDALAAIEAELKVTDKLLSDEARQSLDRLERAEAAEARVADLTAKLEADPAQIRADALREVLALVRGYLDAWDDTDINGSSISIIYDAIIALIDTPPAVSDERRQLKEAFFAGFAEGADGTWIEGDATPAWENYVKSSL